MPTEKETLEALNKRCPHPMMSEPFAWAKWMRDEGYKARIAGDWLHVYIADNIAHEADLHSGPMKSVVPDGRETINGTLYMRDGKGALVPLEVVKPADQLEDEQVRKIIGYATALSDQVSRFKEHTFNDLGDLEALLAQEYGLKKGGEKGNKTFMTFDGLMKVQVQVADLIDFGPTLQIAKTLIDECLNEWAADARAELRAIVTRAFNTDKAGQINRSEIFMLLRLEITDPRWLKAMQAIRDAMRVVSSKTYVRCYRRESVEAGWEAITIDLAKA